jgi:thiamine kinase-like enzyme
MDGNMDGYSSGSKRYDWRGRILLALTSLFQVDAALKSEADHYGTLLHGDVKGANVVFCVDPSTLEDTQSRCALYDFQYTGIGLVTRDLVYFLATTAQSRLLRDVEQEKELLRAYHAGLMQCVKSRREPSDGTTDDESVEEYSFSKLWGHWELALVDWCRFMAGWGFWGNDAWVERRAKQIVFEWDVSGFPYFGQ